MRSALLILVLLLISVSLWGQPIDPPDPRIPIDGASGFLIAAGAAFGIKKILDLNKKKK